MTPEPTTPIIVRESDFSRDEAVEAYRGHLIVLHRKKPYGEADVAACEWPTYRGICLGTAEPLPGGTRMTVQEVRNQIDRLLAEKPEWDRTKQLEKFRLLAIYRAIEAA